MNAGQEGWRESLPQNQAGRYLRRLSLDQVAPSSSWPSDMRGIQDDDDDADEAIAGFVREPETRHASNLLAPDGPRN